MPDRYHIEKLRDMLTSLEYDAQFLYQYGNLAGSLDLFAQLSDDDKKRLLALALIEGNSDVQNVARYLMGKFNPRLTNLESLLSEMNPEDKKEVGTYGIPSSSKNLQSQLTVNDYQRILEELQKACKTIGQLELEEAYWVIIPRTNGEDVAWIEAMGGKDDFFNRVGSPFEVGYSPEKDEEYELITNMRRASWILHIHNHPTSPWMSSVGLPSEKDISFALHWKSVRPELSDKMMFFIVQSDMAVEYAHESGKLRRWI